ncbi:MAG: hypothetical protein GF320_12625 [Armatimonadia bacterium]|nr:hypothetical protein [Armatimonadia bacterium]
MSGAGHSTADGRRVALEELLLALAIRLALAGALAAALGVNSEDAFADYDGYLQIADHIRLEGEFGVAGRTHPVLHRGPLYPAMVALVGGSRFRLGFAILNSLAGALLCVVVAAMARRHFAHAGKLAFWVTCLHPLLLMSIRVCMTQLVGALLVAAVFHYSLREWPKPPTWRSALTAGTLAGLALLTHGGLMPLVVVGLAGMLRIGAVRENQTPRALRHRALPALAALACMVALVAPWALRNSAAASRPMLYSGLGYQYWCGYGIIRGDDPYITVTEELASQGVLFRCSGLEPDFSSVPPDLDERLTQSAIEHLRANAPQVILRRLSEVYRPWLADQRHGWRTLAVAGVPNIIVFLLVVWSRPQRRNPPVFWHLVLATALLTLGLAFTAVTLGDGAYSVYMLPLLLCMIGAPPSRRSD